MLGLWELIQQQVPFMNKILCLPNLSRLAQHYFFISRNESLIISVQKPKVDLYRNISQVGKLWQHPEFHISWFTFKKNLWPLHPTMINSLTLSYWLSGILFLKTPSLSKKYSILWFALLIWHLQTYFSVFLIPFYFLPFQITWATWSFTMEDPNALPHP